MIAISDKIEERTLDFRSNSLISLESPWSYSSGTRLPGPLILNPNITASLTINNVNKKVTYFKILANITSDDTSLSSQSSKNVAVIYKIEYTDSNIADTTDIFYPNFDFEEDCENYTIIELSGDTIKKITIQIINSEDTQISVTDVGLYYITQVTSDNFNDVLGDNYQADPTEMNSIIADYIAQHGIGDIIIPTVSSLPNPYTKPDGYICKLF